MEIRTKDVGHVIFILLLSKFVADTSELSFKLALVSRPQCAIVELKRVRDLHHLYARVAEGRDELMGRTG